NMSQGPGWWQATDGKWYPPEQAPPAVPPRPMPGQAVAVAPSSMPVGLGAPGGALYFPAVPQIESAVRERLNTDRPLIGWGLYFFLLSWVTFGIYSIIIFYRRLNRVELFRQRKMRYY